MFLGFSYCGWAGRKHDPAVKSLDQFAPTRCTNWYPVLAFATMERPSLTAGYAPMRVPTTVHSRPGIRKAVVAARKLLSMS